MQFWQKYSMPACCHCDKIQQNVYFEWSRGLVAQGCGEAAHLTGVHGEREEALLLMVAKKTWTQKGCKNPSDAIALPKVPATSIT